MELQEFIETTLKNIADGVQQAAKNLGHENSETAINPRTSDSKFGYNVQMVDFDIAVTTTESKGGSAKAGIKVFGAEGNIHKEDSTVNRIRFSVPIGFGYTESKKYVEQQRNLQRKSDEANQRIKSRSFVKDY